MQYTPSDEEIEKEMKEREKEASRRRLISKRDAETYPQMLQARKASPEVQGIGIIFANLLNYSLFLAVCAFLIATVNFLTESVELTVALSTFFIFPGLVIFLALLISWFDS